MPSVQKAWLFQNRIFITFLLGSIFEKSIFSRKQCFIQGYAFCELTISILLQTGIFFETLSNLFQNLSFKKCFVQKLLEVNFMSFMWLTKKSTWSNRFFLIFSKFQFFIAPKNAWKSTKWSAKWNVEKYTWNKNF